MREYARLHTAILLRRLAYQLTRAAKSADPESIHDLRVSIRRLSGCLRVFAQFYPGNAPKRIRQRLGKLRESAGVVRDLDITLELMGQAGVSPRTPWAARLQDERRQAYRRLEREIRAWKHRGFSRKWRNRLDL